MAKKRTERAPEPPVEPCKPGMCLAGSIGALDVLAKDWAIEALKFEGQIQLWNEVTKHHAIPHIGYAQRFKFCPACGSAIDTGFVQGAIPSLQLSDDLRLILSLNDDQIAEQAHLLRQADLDIPETGTDQRVAVQHWLMKQYFSQGRGWREETHNLIDAIKVGAAN